MKRIIILVCCFALMTLSQRSLGQIVIDSTDGPNIGEVMIRKNLKPEESVLNELVKPSHYWDFSVLGDLPLKKTIEYTESPSKYTFSSNFPTANVVFRTMDQDTSWTFALKTAEGLYELGSYDKSGPLLYGNGALVYAFPLRYNYRYGDLDTVIISAADKLILTVESNSDVDAYGDVKYGPGVERPCLRVKTHMKQRLYENGRLIVKGDFDIYEWLTKGHSCPVACIEYSVIEQAGLEHHETSVQVMEDVFTEQKKLSYIPEFDIYFSGQELHINSNQARKIQSLEIIDLSGKIAASFDPFTAEGQESLFIGKLYPGVYLVHVCIENEGTFSFPFFFKG